MKTTAALCLLTLCLGTARAQSITPVELITQPYENRVIISGIGGGNLNTARVSKDATSFSGQLGVDWNMGISEGKNYNRLRIHSLAIKYNPVLSARVITRDSFQINKMPFAENEHYFMAGYRYTNTTQTGSENASFIYGGYGDFLISPYSFRFDSSLSQFYTANVNTGFTIGCYGSQQSFGNLGFKLSLEANYIYIYEDSPYRNSYELAMNSPVRLPRNYAGTGGKLIFQLNDFSVYAELRRYWSLDSRSPVPSLSDNLVLNIGGVATGAIFRSSPDK